MIENNEECLNVLSEVINEVDKLNKYGSGDKLFDVINYLREQWGMDKEDG